MSRRHYKSFIDDSARWDALALRDDDIIIATPSKSGTTWMQQCVSLLVFQTPAPPAPMAQVSPWLDMLTWPLDEVIALLDGQQHRRFIKTHTPLDGLPWDERVTYVCVARDPRDASLSMENHMANMDMENVLAARERAVGNEDLDLASLLPPPADPNERFEGWVRGSGADEARVTGLPGVLAHLQTFWDHRDEPNVALFHYSDLQADLAGQLHRLADVLDIDVAEDRWPELVHAATFDEMKKRADLLAPDTTHSLWKDNSQFFHKGQSGRWRDVVSDENLARYDARVAELVEPELAQWAHHGWLGA
jgi:aryl sulfotransferase